MKDTMMAHVKVSFSLSLKLKTFIHIVLLINGSVSYIYVTTNKLLFSKYFFIGVAAIILEKL